MGSSASRTSRSRRLRRPVRVAESSLRLGASLGEQPCGTSAGRQWGAPGQRPFARAFVQGRPGSFSCVISRALTTSRPIASSKAGVNEPSLVRMASMM
jgi:hypothetical protein